MQYLFSVGNCFLPILATLLFCSELAFAAKSSKRPSCFKNVTYSSNQQFSGDANDQPSNMKCIELNHPYCLDIKLPYKATTIPDHLPNLYPADIDEIQGYLERWKGARALPECWPYLQKALCSTLMPECVEDYTTGKVSRVSRSHVEICNDLISNCKFITRHFGWPSLFNCSDTSLFAKNCTNDLRELKLNRTTALCQYPLVGSVNNNRWFHDIDGCTLDCKFPVSNSSDQAGISIFIRILCTLGLLSTSFAIILFGTNAAGNKSSRMAKVIIRSIICEFINYVGWSMQVFFNRSIACSSTGSNLHSLEFEADACLISFFLTYVPSLSNLIWCAYLGKLCYEKLGHQKGPQDTAQVNPYLDLLAFGLPSILFVIAACLKLIDGHGLYGICTVGQQSIIVRTLFIFVPKIIGNLIGNTYFYMTIYTLTQTKRSSPSLRRNFARIMALATLNTIDVIVSMASYIYIYKNTDLWIQSIDNYIACNSNLRSLESENSNYETTNQHCTLSSEPLAVIYYIDLFPTLSIGVVIASWACCESNFRGMRRKIVEVLEDEKDRQRRIKACLIETTVDYKNVQTAINDFTESKHDLIDMTSMCTHTGAMDMNNVDMRKNQTAADWESLSQSVSLTTSQFDNSSTHQPTYYSRGARKAKIIVNDERINMEARRRQAEANLQLQNHPSLPSNCYPIDPVALSFQFQMQQFFQNNQPPAQHLDPDSTPQFIHGMGGKNFGSLSSFK